MTAFHRDMPRDDFRVLDVEMPFSFNIEGVDDPVIGVIDLILIDEAGSVIVVDHKTSSRAYSKLEIRHHPQLTLYHMAARNSGFEDHEILLRIDCLVKTKTPRFEQFHSNRTANDVRRMEGRIRQVWDAMNREAYVPAPADSWKCGGCVFRNHCAGFLSNR